ncbi:hypothetical protein ABZ260_05570, partial [Streptosporangium sp. NPDC006013]
WDLIVNQLNHERVTLGPAGNIAHTYDRFLAWARGAGRVLVLRTRSRAPVRSGRRRPGSRP